MPASSSEPSPDDLPHTSFRPGDLMTQNFTLTLSCPQRPGIVHAVTSFLFSRNCDIAEHQQFDDTVSQSFFLRTKFICGDEIADVAELTAQFGALASDFGMTFRFD